MLKANDRILFEGDSLTTGLNHNSYGRLNGWDRNWADDAMDWLFCQRPDLAVTSAKSAVGGSTCADMLERYEGRLGSFRPSVAMFTIGTNDAIQGVPLDAFSEQLRAYADRLVEDGCRLVVHIAGFQPCPNVDEGARTQLLRCSEYWSVASDVLSQCAAALFVDVGASLRRRAELLVEQWPQHTVYSGGVHYNAVGNAMIAGIVLHRLGLIASPGASEQLL